MRWLNKIKGKVFRKVIDIADNIDIWFKNKFNINLKRKALEASQDNIPLSKLDKTIGKALKIKRIE